MSVLIKEVIPCPDKGSIDLILSAVKSILKQPGIVRLSIDARRDLIEYWRTVSDDEASEKAISLHDALRQVSMEEYHQEADEDKSPIERMFEMFEMVEDAGCSPSHIISGSSSVELRKWFPMSRKSRTLFGVSLHVDGTMEKDVLIICGSRDREATISDIEYAVKVTL